MKHETYRWVLYIIIYILKYADNVPPDHVPVATTLLLPQDHPPDGK